MITKAQVIDLYLASKIESEKLLILMKEQDANSPKYLENLELIHIQIKMIDLLIEAIHQDDEPTQEELQHHFNQALSFGLDEN